ncbi:DUF4240 domain-containing protein [Neptunomonas japonica]|uniref:DUF4240 domain-containing protein n=1 Tax=Neptunomonas japonica TaxID=417574 RepID=UPI0004230CC5|nr:DUF4240 domain-containing protein [Neptunomonas japonica]
MSEDDFWEIIESSGSPDSCSPDEQCENIIERLTGEPKEVLVAFANIHIELLCKGYTWRMLKASFVLISFISDDVFEDFRNWVILQGKKRFYETLKDPDSITNYINVEDPVEEVTGEGLLFVCEESWAGDIEELEQNYVYFDDPDIDDEWPSEIKLQQEFPKLFNQFWDEENIRTLNKS